MKGFRRDDRRFGSDRLALNAAVTAFSVPY